MSAKKEGAIVMRRNPGDNAYEGLVEHSFSMSWEKDRVRFWWSGPAYWCDIPFGVLDGMADAQRQAQQYKTLYPEHDITVFDVHDENLPIVLDWERWLEKKSTSKFEDRNLLFTMKE